MPNQNNLVLIQTNSGGYAYVEPKLTEGLVANGAKVVNPKPKPKKKDLTSQGTVEPPKETEAQQ